MTKQDIIGIDAGGTWIKGGLVRNNKIIKFSKVPVKNQGKFLMRAITDLISLLITPHTKTIGLALPGNIDPKRGILHYCHHYPKSPRHLKVAKALQQKFKIPAYTDHDLNCFTLAEAVVGQGKKYPIVAGVTLGTGFGFAFTVNQKIYHGSQNIIEFGHTIVQKGGARCKCGGSGHLESYVSGKALISLYKKKTGRQKDTYQIVTAAQKGEKTALSTLGTMSDYLAVGLANIIYSYNPHIIVIGGGLSAVSKLVNPARQKVKKLLLYPEQLKTKIVKSKTPYQSNILGAALITNQKKYGQR